MAKITLTFKNQEEYDAYWVNGTPGDQYLCVIESVDVDEEGHQTVSNVLITSTNNQSGKTEVMGTAVVETAQEQAEVIVDNNEQILELETEIEVAEAKSGEVLNGEQVQQ